MAGWEDQWARVQRYLQRLIDAASGHGDLDTMRAVDDAQGFFQSIHHLKDWLRHDPSVTFTQLQGGALIKAHPTLQLCADVCNGSKHLGITGPWTGDATTATVGDLSISDRGVAVRFVILSDNQEHDAIKVATEAVGIWTYELRDLLPATEL